MSVFTDYVDQNFSVSVVEQTLKEETSKADFEAIWKTPDLKKVKACVRGGGWSTRHEVRQVIWKEMCDKAYKDHGNIYNEMITEVFGGGDTSRTVTLPSFVDPVNMLPYHLNERGLHVCKRIVCIIGHTHPDVTYAPYVFALSALFLHYMPEEEVYRCVVKLIQSSKNYIIQTKTSYEASKHILLDLLKKHAKPTYTTLLGIHGDALADVLHNWHWWIFKDLPFYYLVRITDCFLVEGPKVLYRVAMALLVSFHKNILKRNKQFRKEDFATAMSQYCEEIPDTCQNLLRSAFSIRAFSRKELRSTQNKNEKLMRDSHNVMEPPATPHMHHSTSCELLNLKVTRSFDGQLNHETNLASGVHSQGVVPFTESCSSLINMDDWQALWSWLPARTQLNAPHLIYTTNEHGTSIKTFYQKCEQYEPTLILLKTSKQEIIGAYCSEDWENRSQGNKGLSYFGTGETFVFSLSPKRIKYEWVGVKLKDETPRTAHMFMAGDNTKLTVGGGNGEALTLDENLKCGRTEHCQTFNNDLLSSTADFLCVVLEVFSFQKDRS